ncbi:efflux transporter outer membrane subunit [Parabacteroides sp. Marseille-P3160]|uniref:efflux transporter outer membrane subunit n=1 Tax=Parabacteroides sp. Marseille-P3160 TaxID=1917887 RepID=UPI0009B969D2|nr:efflux transporter outer membrane subunit [Parabacteroides sp. Marseille-P3160]
MIQIKKHYKGILLLGLVALVGLSSCQIVNKYKSPEVDMTGLYREEEPTDTTTIASIPWREYFRDPQLQLLIEEGLQSNFDLRIAYTRIQQAEANLSMARASYFPNIALSGQTQQGWLSSGSRGKDVLGYHTTDIYGLGVVVTWEADLWGKLNRQHRAQYAQFLASHTYRNLIQTSLIANIATSYYSLLALDEQLRVVKETVGLLEESARTMQALKEAGFQNAAAVEQSYALLYDTQITIPDLEDQIRQLENTLSVMLGRKPGPIARQSIEAQHVPDELAHGVPVQMLAKRPDVLQAELAFRSAFELTNAARASFYPQVTLNTGTNFGFVGGFNPENLILNILGSITQPLFAQNKLTANLKIAKAQQQEALYNFQSTILTAGKEVSDIMFGFKASVSKNEIRTKQVTSLSKSVDYTKKLLIANEANYLEVIQAEQSYLQARLGQVNDKLEQLQYGVNLYRALGGGIE